MKKVININFQGRVIPIEENAFDILNKYIESLRKHFANEEGRDEIINDIEGRIAELFGETLKKGSTCVTEDDVNSVIDSMGRPEDFDDETTNANSQQSNFQYAQEQQGYNNSNGQKKMFRDEDNKILGGVCSGLANYFGIDPVVIRILFVIFFGVMFIPYIIFWVAVPSSASQVIGSKRKRLFRDPDDKIIAGVCSGIGHYFGIAVWIPRLLFLLPFISFIFRYWDWWSFPSLLKISFSPSAVLVYIILWMILPEAKTTSEKLEMKGEKVDLNNIKNTIQSDIESFAKRAETFGETIKEKGTEFGNTINEKSKQFATEASSVARKKSKGIGDIILLLVKIFVYFIVGCVLIAVVAALLGLGITTTGLLPAKKYIIHDGWQNYFTWGTLLFFVWVPVVGVVVFIIRRIARLKNNSNLIRYTFSALWVIGWICLINLIMLLSKDFKYHNNAYEEPIQLENAHVQKLHVKAFSTRKYYQENNWFKIEPFNFIDEDSITVGNISLRIIQSHTDSFAVKMVKLSNGNSKKQADELSSNINFKASQIDSSLYLDRGIVITPKEKFRNQHVIITIAVPVGKKIYIEKNTGWQWSKRVSIGFINTHDIEWYDSEGKAYYWNYNTEYLMTEKGLEKIKKNSKENDDDDDNDDIDNVQNNWSEKHEKFLNNLTEKSANWKNKQLSYSTKLSISNHYTIPVNNNNVCNKEKPINLNNLLFLRFAL
ncbi:MAG: PspC domain-containing protein [Chitinophagaceae bacterium]|nr:PspC domain-containing protein [Chitinophagaceae bacterium]MCW5905473.1 PspC domain-containing protein [Chitinophagaceae bacterium]